jgi:hypothetical protein
MAESHDIEKKVEEIFNNLDVIRLNDSFNRLINNEDTVIEDFTRKYSAIIIFFFSILDEKRKELLLKKLTESALFYLIEEELRMLVLREMTAQATDPEIFTLLSGFLDSFMVSGDKDLKRVNIYDEASEALKLLSTSSDHLKLRHFSYLNTLPNQDLAKLSKLIIDKNINIALVLLIYVPSNVASILMDTLVLNEEEKSLQFIPDTFIEDRIRRGDFYIYVTSTTLKYLPEKLRDRVTQLAGIIEKYTDFLITLDDVYRLGKMKEKSKGEVRQYFMNKIYKQIKTIAPLEREILLSEIVRQKYLSIEDAEMLKAAINIF